MKLIKNGTVMTMGPQGTLQADILIENGKIIDIAEKITAEGAEIIDAAGLLVLPGLVDAHSQDRKSTRLNSSHIGSSRMPSSA